MRIVGIAHVRALDQPLVRLLLREARPAEHDAIAGACPRLFHHALASGRLEGVVGVEEAHVVACGLANAHVAGARRPAVLLVDDADVQVVRGPLLDDLA